ncbi:TonB-dependent vitamin B12 receptor [Maricurvus nonylphenolicus]|uniref:TonB-dependent receptor domain-containing protein n=1 Tax=Maricurvus nonylphenolicus TaxID=1008307 RepID=UPI0036F35F28
MFKKTVMGLALASAPVAWAVETAKPVDENIIVTATRTEQNLEDSLSSVTLISKEDIARTQAQDIFQILSNVPGLNMHRTGATGSPISVLLRGTSTNQTLFLLDGQRISSATLGQPNLAGLDANQIERIEIVRGPKASLYGADALGGVIQIFTKRADQDRALQIKSGIGSDLFNGGESLTTQKHTLGFATPITDSTDLSVNLFYEHNSGVDDTFNQDGGSDDKDANRKQGINLSLSHRLEKGSITAQYLFNKVHTEYDSGNGCTNIFYGTDPCQPYSDQEVENLNVSLQYELTDVVGFSASTGFSKDLSETGDDLNGDPTQVLSVSNIFETSRDFVTLQTNFALSEEHLVTVGADYYKESIDGHVYVNGGSFGVPAARSGYLDENGEEVDSRDNLAFFGQYQADVGRNHFVVGIREDDNEKYGHNTTGNIAWGFDLSENLQIVASWGEAYRAPSFNDLYWPDGANPFLEPEESETYEIGLKGTWGDSKWEISVYETDIENLIEWAPAPTLADPHRWQPSNVESSEVKGVELQLTTLLNEWQLVGSYTHLDATYEETVGNNYDGNRMQGRPEHTVKLDAYRSWGVFSLGFNWIAESSRTQHKSEEPETAGYGVLGIRGNYQLTEEVSLQLKVDNLFDKDYTLRSYSYGFPSTWENYNTLGRTAFFSVTYTPGL